MCGWLSAEIARASRSKRFVEKHAPPARLAFDGRVVELLDLLPAFRAYV
jgi:hypothetical protein